MMKYLVRSLIIGGWIALLSLILYLPSSEVIPHEDNSINVFAWGDILDPAVIARFEKETKIKVNLNYYSSNEELLVKLKANKGFGYDLIIPSDYAVALLAQEGLLKPLDKTQLQFWKHLNPLLLGHPFDPENVYSIPFEWELFGFGIDQDYFNTHPLNPSWDLVFRPQDPIYRIAMVNDPVEAVSFAAFYLYGPTKELSQKQMEGVKRLLIEQKKWVEAYASFRADYFLATKNCPVVIASSSYLWRTMRLFPFVKTVIPKEGTFITIENLCVPALTTKEDAVYRLINYLYQPEIVAMHFHKFGFFPSTTNSIPYLNMDPEAKALISSSPEDFRKFHFINKNLPEQKIRDLWVAIKTKSQAE